MLLTNPIVTHIEGFYSTFRIPPLPWRGGTGTHFRNSKWKAVLSFGPFFLDFGPDQDFIHEICPDLHKKFRIWRKMDEWKLVFFIMNSTMK